MLETTESNVLPDVLDNDLTGIDTSYPVLRAGTYNMTLTSMKVVPHKDPSKPGQNLEFVLSLDDKGKTPKGDDVLPGHKITDRFSLTPTAEYPKERVLQSLKRIREAAGMGEGPFGSPEQYIGKKVLVKLSIKEDPTGQYEPANRVRFVPKE